MDINTRIFGQISIEDDKLINFPQGIVGFPELTDFAIVHDSEQGEQAGIRWMQSIQEPGFAMPVIDPLMVVDNYNPEVDDELLKTIGGLGDVLVLVTITVPADITKMTVNLKAPFVINVEQRKACQVILEQDLQVKFPIYDILQKRKQAVKVGE